MKHLAFSLTLTLLLSAPVTAQTLTSPAATPSPEQAGREEGEQRRQAFALLDEALTEALALRLVENRLFAQALAADLLWTHDERRARALYREMMNDLGAALRAMEGSEPNYYELISGLSASRHELLNKLAARDPALALEFLRATRVPLPPALAGLSRLYAQEMELNIEMGLAARMVEHDPQRALRLAEELLERGLAPGMMDVLARLWTKEHDAAVELTGGLLRRLRAEDLTSSYSATQLALALMRTATAAQTTPPNTPPASVVLSERDYRDRAELLAATAARLPAAHTGHDTAQQRVGHDLFRSLPSILPLFERYAPARLPDLRRRVAAFNRTLDPRSRVWAEHGEVINGENLEALLAAIPQMPAEMREEMYGHAANKAFAQGNMERARQIINEHINDPARRQQALDNLQRQSLYRASEQGDLNEVRRMLAQVRAPEERLSMLVNFAAAAARRDDRQTAKQLLAEASDLLGGRAANFNQFNLLLQMAALYAALEPPRSFETIELAIDQLNELLAAATVLNGFGQNFFRDDELTPQGSMLSGMVRQSAAVLATLARADFARARIAAGRFQRPEARVMARLLVAQGALGAQQPGAVAPIGVRVGGIADLPIRRP